MASWHERQPERVAHRKTAVVLAILLLALLAVNIARAHDTHSASPNALQAGFACIHRHEGAWNARTGNGYYGGLQMDMTFQRTYGAEYLRAWGTADRWPPSVQVAVAMRAYLSGRGYSPWPNTARSCGLL